MYSCGATKTEELFVGGQHQVSRFTQVHREGVPYANGSGVNRVVIDVASALELYIFASITVSSLCSRAQGGTLIRRIW